MPFTTAEEARAAVRKRWDRWYADRLIKEAVDRAPALTDEQRATLAAIFASQPAPAEPAQPRKARRCRGCGYQRSRCNCQGKTA